MLVGWLEQAKGKGLRPYLEEDISRDWVAAKKFRRFDRCGGSVGIGSSKADWVVFMGNFHTLQGKEVNVEGGLDPLEDSGVKSFRTPVTSFVRKRGFHVNLLSLDVR